MKNREQQYHLYLQERENLLSDMIDFGYDLYKKLLTLPTSFYDTKKHKQPTKIVIFMR